MLMKLSGLVKNQQFFRKSVCGFGQGESHFAMLVSSQCRISAALDLKMSWNILNDIKNYVK